MAATVVRMSHAWVPFGISEDEATRYVEVLIDGVPVHMEASLLAWIRSALSAEGWVSATRVREIERATEVLIGIPDVEPWTQSLGIQCPLVWALGG